MAFLYYFQFLIFLLSVVCTDIQLVVEELTPQPYSPTGLDLELLKLSLKIPPKVPIEWTPDRPGFRVSLGAASAALGSAL